MDTLPARNAILSAEPMYPCVITQPQMALPRDPRRECKLKVRNVSDKRDDEAVQIEVRILTFHGRRTDHASVSVSLTREAARAMAAELLRGLDAFDTLEQKNV